MQSRFLSDSISSSSAFCSFRRDYRLERKLLSGESLFEAEADSPRRGISQVVVHNSDSDLAAVYDCEDNFDTPEFWSGSITWW